MAAAAPEAPTRGHKKKERTRRLLIAAAVDVIGERGEAFTISDVTARAEVSNGTFYNYFDDREALIEALIPAVLAGFVTDTAASVDEPDPAVRFATITALALDLAATSAERMRVVLRLDVVQRAVLEGAVLDHLRADLIDGARSGRFAAKVDDATVDVVVGALLLAARRIVDHPVADDYAARVIAQQLRSLGVDQAEAAEVAGRAVSDARRGSTSA